VLITGGSSGIGKAAALKIAAARKEGLYDEAVACPRDLVLLGAVAGGRIVLEILYEGAGLGALC